MFFQAKHQKRFIYFRGEIPEFGSEALSEIKAEEGLEESLDTAQLLDASNQLIVSYAEYHRVSMWRAVYIAWSNYKESRNS